MAVHEQQPLEEAELAHRVVARVDRLKSFFSCDADADIGGLDHRDVVGAVTDSEAHGSETVLDKADDEGLLERRGTAADDGAAPSRELEEDLLGVLLLEGVAEGGTVNDETVATGALTIVVADDVRDARDAGCGAVELEGTTEAARPASGGAVRRVGRLMFELLGESFGVEEALESTAELVVGRVGLAVLAALDDDEVHVAREEVARLGDGDGGLELVTGGNPDLGGR